MNDLLPFCIINKWSWGINCNYDPNCCTLGTEQSLHLSADMVKDCDISIFLAINLSQTSSWFRIALLYFTIAKTDIQNKHFIRLNSSEEYLFQIYLICHIIRNQASFMSARWLWEKVRHQHWHPWLLRAIITSSQCPVTSITTLWPTQSHTHHPALSGQSGGFNV